MAWEIRKNLRVYYRSRREGHQVHREYFSGLDAELAAALDAKRRCDRQAERNWDRQGQTIGNNAYTFLSAEDGTINVRCGTSTGGGTHFILDLIAILFLADLGPEPLEMRAMQADRAARIAAARR